MARTKTIPIIFNKGLETGQDPKLVIDGFLRAENIEWPRENSIQLRDGYYEETDTSSGGDVLAQFKDTVADCFANSGPYIWNGSAFETNTNNASATGHVETHSIDVGQATEIIGPSVAFYGDIGGIVYRIYDGSSVKAYLVRFKTDLSFVGEPEELPDADATPRIVAAGYESDAYLYVIWIEYDGANFNLKYSKFNDLTTSLTTGTIKSSINWTALNNNYGLGVCLCWEKIAIIYPEAISSIGDDLAHVIIWDWNSESINAETGVGSAVNGSSNCRCVFACSANSGNEVLVGYTDNYTNTKIFVQGFDEDLNVEFAESTVYDAATDLVTDACAKVVGDFSTIYVWTNHNSYYANDVDFSFREHKYTGSWSETRIYGARLASEPFQAITSDGFGLHEVADSNIAIASCRTSVSWEDDVDASIYLSYIPTVTYKIGAPILKRTFASYQDNKLCNGLSRFSYYSDNEIIGVAREHADEDTQKLTLVKIKYDDSEAVAFNANGYLMQSTRSLFKFDGRDRTVCNFNEYPVKITGEDGGGSSGGDAGSYYYTAVYYRRDAMGNEITSAPSPLSDEITTAGTDTLDVDLLIADTDFFVQASDWKIKLYRNKNGDTTTYYLVDIIDGAGASPTTGFISFNDTVEDSGLGDETLNYTPFGAGELVNLPPPAGHISTEFDARAWIVDAAKPQTKIWYSKKYKEQPSIAFNDELFIECNSNGGKITALRQLDDKLLIFKENKIYMTYGDGYDKYGQGSNYASPVLIADSIGATNQRKMANIQHGIIFYNDNGVFLINRKLEIHEIGTPVDYYIKNMVTQGGQWVVWPERGYIVIPDSSSNSKTLIFDYINNRWFVWDLRMKRAAAAAGTLYWINNSNELCYVDGTRTSDYYASGSYNITATLETGWIPLDGFLQDARIRKLILFGHAETNQSLSLTVQAQFDYTPYWETAQTYSTPGGGTYDFSFDDYFDATPSQAADDGALIVDCVFSRQRATSVRFRITFGTGYILNGMALEVRPKGRSFFTDGNRRF